MMGERALRVCQHPDPQKPEIRGGLSTTLSLKSVLWPSMREFCMMLCGYSIDSLRTQEMGGWET